MHNGFIVEVYPKDLCKWKTSKASKVRWNDRISWTAVEKSNNSLFKIVSGKQKGWNAYSREILPWRRNYVFAGSHPGVKLCQSLQFPCSCDIYGDHCISAHPHVHLVLL